MEKFIIFTGGRYGEEDFLEALGASRVTGMVTGATKMVTGATGE